MEYLSLSLKQRRRESLIADAEFIRDWPVAVERINEAQKLIREAMLQCTLGHITQGDEYRIYSILSFAMPSDSVMMAASPDGY